MAAIPSKNIRLEIYNDYNGYGNVQSYNGTSVDNSGTITGLGLVTSISLGGITTADIDTTSLASTTKSAIMGTMDSGTCDVSFIAKSGQSSGLAFYKPTTGSNSPYSWRIAFTDGTYDLWYLYFSGYIQSTNLEAAVDSAVSGTMTIRITADVWIDEP